MEAARNCSGRRRRPAEILPRGRPLPHAELESGASVGTSDLEVKTTTRVRVTPRIALSAPFSAGGYEPGRPGVDLARSFTHV